MSGRSVSKNIGLLIVTIGLSIGVSALTSLIVRPAGTATAAKDDSVYQRVMQRGAIRCAYAEYPPFFHKDPNSGAFSGISYDVTEKIGDALGLKIEWTEEVAWGSIIEGLVSDRYDAFCSDLWTNPVRGKMVDFSQPIAYSLLNAYGRKDETRFADLKSLNDPAMRIAVMDGEMGDLVARSQFPAAQRVAMPQGSDVSQLFLEVTSGKADVMFAEPAVFAAFDKSNPGELTNLTPGHPVRVLPNTIAFRRGQVEFKSMIDHALEEMINSGQMDALLKKYEPFPDAIYRDAVPYQK